MIVLPIRTTPPRLRRVRITTRVAPGYATNDKRPGRWHVGDGAATTKDS